MTGEASQWYTLLERNRDTPSWEEFTQLVNKRFGPRLRSNPLGELIQLHREGTVAEYQVNIFTAGLRNPLRMNVELENPTTPEDAMALARTYEQRLSMVDDVPARLPPAKASAFCTPSKPLMLPAPSSMPATPLSAPRMK
jgi:hypothetical protein